MKVGPGGGEAGPDAVVLKKPVNKKKEFGCFKYLLARSQMDEVCRILVDATNELADMPGLTESRYDKIRERLRETPAGLRYMKALPEPGPSTMPNWCELRRRISIVDDIIRIEKKRKMDGKAEEASVKKAAEASKKADKKE